MKSIETDKETFYNLLLRQPDKPNYQQEQNINTTSILINVLKRLILHVILYNYRYIIIVI